MCTQRMLLRMHSRANDTHIKGYAGRFSDFVLDHIRSMPEVAFVERDQILRTLEVEHGVNKDAECSKTQNGAP